MKNKKIGLFEAISDVLRRLSITFNMTVYSIYLVYLIISIFADIGVKWLNIVLAIMTAAFMVVYIVLRLSSEKRAGEIKKAKRYYKRFKMIARAVSSLTAVYALIVAFDTSSPLAPIVLIASLLGAVFVVLRLICELITHLIGKALKKAGAKISDRMRSKKGEIDVVEPPRELKSRGKKKARHKQETNLFDDIEEKITPESECLLNDFEGI